MSRRPWKFPVLLLFAVLLLLAALLAPPPAAMAAQDESARRPASQERARPPLEGKSACEQMVERAQAAAALQPPPRSFGFPPVPEIEYENSLISFRVCKVKKNLTPEQEERRKKSWKCCDPEFYDVELVKLDAYMRLCREAPVLNELGFREIRFTIEKWELFGHSNLYDADIIFSATPGVVQPKSLAFSSRSAVPKGCLGRRAQRMEKCRTESWKGDFTELSRSDFPALIVYNAIYDVWVNDKKIVSQEPGVAMARGAMQIPPTGVTVAFQKPIDIPDVIKICPGTCAGMVTISRAQFEAGLRVAERLKVGELRLDTDFQPEAVKREATIPTP